MAKNKDNESENGDEYDENEASRKKKPLLKRDISSSSVLSTISCGTLQESKSVRSLYPPPKSISSKDLPSSYESASEEDGSMHEIPTKRQTSREVVFREFSKMLLAFDGDQMLSSENTSDAISSGHDLRNETTMMKKRDNESLIYHVQLSKNIILKNAKEENSKRSQHKIYATSTKDIEHLESLEDCLRLPISSKELLRITFAENLMISYNEIFDEEKNFCTSEEIQAIKTGGITKYPKIRNLMPNKSSLVGAFCIKVKSYDSMHIITFCSSQQSLNGSGGSSRTISTLNKSFKLVEEKKSECQIFPNKKIEKILHVVKENDRFIVFHTELNEKEQGYHTRGEITLPSGDMLLDGGSYVLIRYLILKRFTGQLKFWSIDIAGSMCKCVYEIGKIRVIHINNIPYKTYRVKKTLLRQGRRNDISKSYYLPSGFLVRHEWHNCPFFLHINPLSKIPPKIYPNLEEDWMNDVILTSKYLDEKDKRVSEIKTYIGDHPQISNMLKDYILCLLYNQPENIFDYTIDYFLNLFKEK